MSQEDLEKRLEELIALVKGINRTSELPTVLSYADAARELNISKKTLQRRINAGLILICDSGIPRAEIERLATPRPRFEPQRPPPRGPRPPKVKGGLTEAQKIHAALKTKH